jgi:DNA repair exonuclease SbcCD nuclease subunit
MSTKILRIGDPHIKPSNVEECEKLMHFIADTIRVERPNRVEIMGDLFHTHSIVHLSVLEFWDGWLDVLIVDPEIEVFVLVGNHDKATTEEFSFSALSVFKHMRAKNLKICELPRVDGPFAYVPYYHNPQTFIEIANNCAKEGAKVLVCHQTFDGSYYENGFYAPDGIDASKLHFDLIISGHIHTRQELNNVATGQKIIYPGTPKWDTSSDANEDKGIWLYEHDDKTGAIISERLLRTAHVVTKIVHLTWKEGEPQEAIPSGCKVSIELVGSRVWVDAQKESLKGQVQITTKITDKATKKEREAGNSFPEFVAKKFQTDVDRIELLRYMKELDIV